MLDSSNNVKLADFGISAEWKRGEFLKDSCGSPEYAAPELLDTNCVYEGPEIDIWSSGVVLYALICISSPFDADNNTALFNKIRTGRFKIPHFVSPDARDLLQQILQVDPNKRIKLDGVKKHRWLESVFVTNTPSVVQDAEADEAEKETKEYSEMISSTILSVPLIVSPNPARYACRHGSFTDRQGRSRRSRARPLRATRNTHPTITLLSSMGCPAAFAILVLSWGAMM